VALLADRVRRIAESIGCEYRGFTQSTGLHFIDDKQTGNTVCLRDSELTENAIIKKIELSRIAFRGTPKFELVNR
jgi:hypothetical protein